MKCVVLNNEYTLVVPYLRESKIWYPLHLRIGLPHGETACTHMQMRFKCTRQGVQHGISNILCRMVDDINVLYRMLDRIIYWMLDIVNRSNPIQLIMFNRTKSIQLYIEYDRFYPLNICYWLSSFQRDLLWFQSIVQVT